MPTTSLALAFSLSVDSFAVALGRGAAVHRTKPSSVLSVGVAFGICQTVTPLAGWAIGIAFADVFQFVDHWVTFFLMLAVGTYLIASAGPADQQRDVDGHFRFLSLCAAAMASSMDAATVGLGLGVIEHDIVETVAAIGGVTFLMSCLGVAVGRYVGHMLGRWAGISGGALLIALGLKVLFEHGAA